MNSQRKSSLRRRHLHDVDAGGNDFLSNAVAGNHSYAICLHVASMLSSAGPLRGDPPCVRSRWTPVDGHDAERRWPRRRGRPGWDRAIDTLPAKPNRTTNIDDDAGGDRRQRCGRTGAPGVQTAEDRHEQRDDEQRIEDRQRADDRLQHDGQHDADRAADRRAAARATRSSCASDALGARKRL